MKNNILVVILVTLLMSSCYKDMGNYDYDETEVISVEGIRQNYKGITMIDSLIITPKVTSTTPDAEFEYFWLMYQEDLTGTVAKVDTLSHTKDIRFLIDQNSPNWRLIFSVRNKNTGLSKLISCTLSVETAYTRGWYVLKDDGANSDLDMFRVKDTITPTSMTPNIYSKINGKNLEGKAKMINYFTSYKTFVDVGEDGKAKNTNVLVAMSEKDIAFNYINTLEEVRSFDDFAYEAPAVKDMGYIGFSHYRQMYYTINDGKVHKIAISYPNSGVFTAPIAKDDKYSDYNLSDFALTSRKFRLFYDETSSSFITHAGGTSATMTPVKAMANSEMATSNTNKEMIYMGVMDNTSRNTPAVAFMRDKNDNTKSLARISPLTNNFEISINNLKDIDKEQKLYDATLISTSQDEAVLYFAVNNELWSRNLSSGLEKLQFSAADGEEITMIRHRKYGAPKEPRYKYNYVIVGTTSASNDYKIYFFQKRAGNLESAPDFIKEGTGRIKDIMFISPNIKEDEYMQGY
ncbi:MAG: PKD-like family lipoprotein [Bacteroidales bacterium]